MRMGRQRSRSWKRIPLESSAEYISALPVRKLPVMGREAHILLYFFLPGGRAYSGETWQIQSSSSG